MTYERARVVMEQALKVDEAFAYAANATCTCGSDPEGPCAFCNRWRKADQLENELMALFHRGLDS